MLTPRTITKTETVQIAICDVCYTETKDERTWVQSLNYWAGDRRWDARILPTEKLICRQCLTSAIHAAWEKKGDTMRKTKTVTRDITVVECDVCGVDSESAYVRSILDWVTSVTGQADFYEEAKRHCCQRCASKAMLDACDRADAGVHPTESAP